MTGASRSITINGVVDILAIWEIDAFGKIWTLGSLDTL
jgi:hypothetical protein